MFGVSSGFDMVQVAAIFDYELLRSDMKKIKERKGLTYAEIAEKCGCHLQSVYKFVSGEYPELGDKLRYRFVWFVREHWIMLDRDERGKIPDIQQARYMTRIMQGVLPLEFKG